MGTRDLVERISKLARARMAAGPVVQISDAKSLKNKKTPTLLIVEDDESVRRSLQRIIEGLNFRVLAARDGVELSEVFGDVLVDLVVLDVGLPWVNGYELAQMMKEDDALKSVPILFISGSNDVGAMKKGFEVGAHDYITKPFDVKTVQKTICALLELSGAFDI